MSTAALHFESNSTGIDNYGNTVQNTCVVRGHLDNRVAILELCDGEKCREERLKTVESAVAASGAQRHLIHIEAIVRQKRLLLEIKLSKLVSDVLQLLYALLGELAENRITRLIRLRVLVSIQIVNGTFGLGGEQLLPHLNLVLLLGTTLQIVVERSAITVAVEHLDEF